MSDDRLMPYATQEYVDNRLAEIKTYTLLRDEATGYLFGIKMENNSLTSEMLCMDIYCDGTTVLSFTEGETTDCSNLTVYKTYLDGTTSTVDMSKVTYYPEVISRDTKYITIKYDDFGVTHTTNVLVNVEPFNPEVVLIDFEYTANEDGTYTLTGWKQTLNGEASTDMVIPFNNLIIL